VFSSGHPIGNLQLVRPQISTDIPTAGSLGPVVAKPPSPESLVLLLTDLTFNPSIWNQPHQGDYHVDCV